MNARRSETDENIWVLEARGRIDADRAPELETHLTALMGVGHASLVVDFERVSYISSSGLKVLLVALRTARQQGGDIRLCAMNERVRNVFDLSGFHKIFDIYPSEAEAVSSFRRNGAG